MRTLQRWATSVASSFEGVVSQLENHEALVASALREMQTAEGRAKVQIARVARDGETMRKRIAELTEMDHVWAERAFAVHDNDKERALECLRRKKQAERERAALEEQLAAHCRLEGQLKNDLKVIGERIAELKRKKNALSARQYRTQALKAGSVGDIGLISEIDEIFDRWEMKLGECDFQLPTVDDFAAKFEDEESVQELEAGLAALVAERNAAAR